jgi:hypothetical protein
MTGSRAGHLPEKKFKIKRLNHEDTKSTEKSHEEKWIRDLVLLSALRVDSFDLALSTW